MKPSVIHTRMMEKVAETIESALYEKYPEDIATVRRVTDCDFLITKGTPEGDKAIRVSVRKA